MSNPYKDGYVLFHFPGSHQITMLVNEWRVKEPEVGVCIVDNTIDALLPEILELGKVHFVRGGVLEQGIYEKAGILKNKVVIVFPKNPNDSDSDGVTKTTVDLLKRHIGDNPVRLVHLLVNPNNAWMFDGSVSAGVLEGLELLAIAQECQDPYTSAVTERLLKNSEGANPHTVPVRLLSGMTWQQVQIAVITTAAQLQRPVNLLALIRDAGVQVCPSFDEVVQEGDQLSILAFNGFRWAEFEKAVAQMRG